MEIAKLSFIEFVEKFFPEQIVSEHHKKFIQSVSEQLTNNPKSTLIIYDGRGSRTKSLLHKYISERLKITINEVKQNGNTSR